MDEKIPTIFVDSQRDLGIKGFLQKPKIAIIVIQSRTNDAWEKALFGSIQSQFYDFYDLIRVENYDREFTIGRCFNEAVKHTDAEYCFFIGDDDFIAPDCLIAHYSCFIYHTVLNQINAVFIASAMTLVNEESNIIDFSHLHHTGLWKTDFLKKNKFVEMRGPGEDTKMREEAEKQGFTSLFMEHYYGYYYRQHDDQISGRKV